MAPENTHQKAQVERTELAVSQKNHSGENGFLETLLNLRTQSRAPIPKHIMIDSIRINLDWVRIAVSEIKNLILKKNYQK